MAVVHQHFLEILGYLHHMEHLDQLQVDGLLGVEEDLNILKHM